MKSRKYRLDKINVYVGNGDLVLAFVVFDNRTNRPIYYDKDIAGVVNFCKVTGITKDLGFCSKEFEQLFNKYTK